MFPPRNVGMLVTRAQREGDPAVQRTMHFISTLRGSMLVNGDVLGNRHIDSWRDHHSNHAVLMVVHYDNSWDEGSGEHVQHDRDDRDYDQEPG